MSKICKCRQTQIKLCSDDSGNKWYIRSLINGNTGQYRLDFNTGYINHQEVVYLGCDNPDCDTVMEMRDHISGYQLEINLED